MDVELMPPPPPLMLKRQFTMSDDQGNWADQENTVRYLQYEVGYRACKYKSTTWGDLVQNDYLHFKDLMTHHVPLESKTFKYLVSQLKPEDAKEAMAATRVYDTEAGRQAIKDRFLDYVCNHKGRMQGKKWGEVLKNDYEYFKWSVANTMGRDTRTYEVLLSCLKEADQKEVESTKKGEYKRARPTLAQKAGWTV